MRRRNDAPTFMALNARRSMSKSIHRAMRSIVRQKRGAIGAPPGTIQIDPEAPPPVVSVMAWSAEKLIERDGLDDLDAIRGEWPVVWVNVDGLGDEALLRDLAARFHLHRLALEDVVNTHQRAKVEAYDELLFIVLRMIRAGIADHEQISIFLVKNVVLTFQERRGDCFEPVRERVRQSRGRIRRAGADYLAYALIDAIVDAYFPVIEGYGNRLELMEQDLLHKPDAAMMEEIHAIKRELLGVRRTVWPLREALSTLMRDEHPLIVPETRIYLRDCYDHAVQVIDIVETCRELASSQMDLYLSSVGQHTNEIMKVLTLFAAIFIPLSFIAGLFGMNFDTSSPYNQPELSLRYGYFMALGVMLMVAGGLLLYFWKKGWIGRRSKRQRRGEPAPAEPPNVA